MHNRRTDAELVEILKLKRSLGSAAAVSRHLGMSPGAAAIKDALKDAEARGLTADTPIMDATEKLKIELAQARRDLKSLQKEADSAERIRTEIYNLAARTPEPPAWISKFQPKKGVNNSVPMTLWSDWHFGEVVRPEEVGGVNQFNAEIAAARINTLVEKTIDLCHNHMGRAQAKFPGIIVALGGDMISGDLHEELFATNDRTTQQCINDLTDLLAGALGKLADTFGKVFVPCVVGNHGRSSRKPRMKGRVYTSHEWNIYCNLERYFRRDPRVTFMIPGETDAYFKVYGHRFLLTHGDSLGVKGGDGIIGAIGPIKRGTIKIGHSEAQIGRDVDTVLMGHWHQMLWLPGCIVNGSLKGYDEYARLALRAGYEVPIQALWLVHPTYGITARWEIQLDKRQAATENNEWLTWLEPRRA